MSDAPIRFVQGDSTTRLMELPPDSVDVVVTSPYYNIGTDYGEYKDADPREQYLLDMMTWGLAVRRALKPNGSLFLNIDGKPSDPWVPFDVLNCFRDQFVLQNTLHWIKSIAIDGKTYGHYKPINSDRFVNQCHEYIFHLTVSGAVPLQRTAVGVPYSDPSNLKRWQSAGRSELHCRGNCWLLPYETRQKRSVHPAEFPPALPEFCLRLHGIPDQPWSSDFLVCDPFCGTGGTAIACARLGVRCIGFDINCLYLVEAAQRVHQLANVATCLIAPLGHADRREEENDEMGRGVSGGAAAGAECPLDPDQLSLSANLADPA